MNRGGGLEILEERVMLAIPRGEEELRFSFTRARTADGKEVGWHSLRVFWKDDSGTWRPGKAGITIRGRELKPVVEAMLKASAGLSTSTPASTTQRPRGARAPEHRETSSRQPPFSHDAANDPVDDEGVF